MRRTIACLLITGILLSGCMSAPRTVASPRTFIPIKRPERVWLVDKDGERLEVTRPRILPGDTLFGRSRIGEEIWIALSDVQRIQARELDKRKTFLVVGGGLAAAGVFIALSAGSGGGIDKDDIDRPSEGSRPNGLGMILFRTR
jgi:hypothetical protein